MGLRYSFVQVSLTMCIPLFTFFSSIELHSPVHLSIFSVLVCVFQLVMNVPTKRCVLSHVRIAFHHSWYDNQSASAPTRLFAWISHLLFFPFKFYPSPSFVVWRPTFARSRVYWHFQRVFVCFWITPALAAQLCFFLMRSRMQNSSRPFDNAFYTLLPITFREHTHNWPS